MMNTHVEIYFQVNHRKFDISAGAKRELQSSCINIRKLTGKFCCNGEMIHVALLRPKHYKGIKEESHSCDCYNKIGSV